MDRRSWVFYLLLISQWQLSGDDKVPVRETRYGPRPGTKTHFQIPRYSSLKEWLARRAQLREQILVAGGLVPMPAKTPLKPQRSIALERKDYRIERIWIETFPGFQLAGNLYMPNPAPRKAPAVLIAHGHWKHGRIENLDEYSVPALGINLARQGYVAFAYDMVGYNDTRQVPHEFGDNEEHRNWMFHSFGVQLWNSMRSLDFLESLPEVDRARMAITGASGGGTQSFFLAAVDNRISAVAPVNMVSAHMQGGCRCENAPGLRVGTCNPELAALAAPRPMLLVSTTQDWTKNTPVEEFPAIRRIYELYGQREKVDFAQFDAVHNYNRDSRMAVYRFLHRELKRHREPMKDFKEAPVDFDVQTLLWNSGIQEELDYVFGRWRQQAAQALQALDRYQWRKVWRATIGTEWPKGIRYWSDGRRITLGRRGTDDVISGVRLNPKGKKMVLVVDPSGGAGDAHDDAVQRMSAAGYSIWLIDVFQTGTSQADYGGGKFFLTFNRSVDALRVQDIVTTVAYLAGQTALPIEVYAKGDAAIWAASAKAALPVAIGERVVLTGPPNPGARAKLSIPGFDKAGGPRIMERAQTPAAGGF